MGWLTRLLADPDIDSYLLTSEGEVVIDEVRKHWVCFARPAVEFIGGVVAAVLLLISPVWLGWLPLLVWWVLWLHAIWLALSNHVDRFVITNMRVFRVTGVFSRKQATMPMMRILDITVRIPLLGRFLDYGHFVFESAAQSQGLQGITFVPRPQERDLTIQRVVQRSGARRSFT